MQGGQVRSLARKLDAAWHNKEQRFHVESQLGRKAVK